MHDGLPAAAIEFMLSGRYVITNVEMPYVEKLSGQGNAASARDEIIEKIREINDRVNRDERPDTNAAEFYRTSLNADHIAKRVRRIIETVF